MTNLEQKFSERLKLLFARITTDFDWFGDFELVIAAFAVAALFLLGPIILVIYLTNHNQGLVAIVIGVFWLASVLQGVRDFRKRKFSWPTGVLTILWLVSTVILAIAFLA